MNEWEKQRKEFQDKYHNNDHEALMKLLDYGDLINLQANTYTDRAIKAESKLRAIGEIIKAPDKYELLIKQWENDIKTYPDTKIGGYCRAVLRCCIRELNKIIVVSKIIVCPWLGLCDDATKTPERMKQHCQGNHESCPTWNENPHNGDKQL